MPQYCGPNQTAITAEYTRNDQWLVHFPQNSGPDGRIKCGDQFGSSSKSTTNRNNRRACYVDDGCKRIGNQLEMSGNRPSRLRFAFQPFLQDRMATRIYTVQKLMQLFDPARAANRIDATALTAATIEARNRHCLSVYFYTRVEDRAMPPFASQTGFTANQSTVDNKPAANTCAQHCAKNYVVPLTGPFDSFCKGQTISIIGGDHLSLQSLAEFKA